MKKILSFFLLWVCSFAHSQNLKQFTQSIIGVEPNDSLKVIRISDWVSRNIAVDTLWDFSSKDEQLIKYLEESIKIENIIRTKKTVWPGVVKLLKDICDEAKIQTEIVDGIWTDKSIPNLHYYKYQWIMVKINQKWLFVDVIRSKNCIFFSASKNKISNKQYVLIESEDFLNEYYPYDPLWQFRMFPATFDEFMTGNPSANQGSRPLFYYSDTLATFEKMNHLNRKISTILRAVRFNQDFDFLYISLIQLYHKESFEHYTAYRKIADDIATQIRKSKKPVEANKSLTLANKSKIFSHLDSALLYVNKAIESYNFIKDPNLIRETISGLEGLKGFRDAVTNNIQWEKDNMKNL